MTAAVLSGAVARGWEAELVLPYDAEGRSWIAEIVASGVRVSFAPCLPRRHQLRWLHHHLSDHSLPTILHTHFTSFDIAAAVFARGKPMIHTFWHVRSGAPNDPLTLARNMIKYRVVARQVEAILCSGPGAAEVVCRRGGRRRMVLVENAVDLDRFSVASAGEREAARAELGLNPDASVLLHFSWHWKIKGGETFLDVVEMLAKRRDVRGLMVGEAVARKAVDRRGLSGLVTVMEPRQDVRTMYLAADVLVAASRMEGGVPFVVLEALACGLPVAATDIPSHRRLAEELNRVRLGGITGDTLAVAAEELIALDPAAASSDRQRLEVEWSLPAYVGRMLDRYDAVLGR